MLNLIEDEARINECFQEYLLTTKVHDWRYEDAIKKILALEFQPDNLKVDMKKLGTMYKSIVENVKSDNLATCSEAEKLKITNVLEHIDSLCVAAQIQKLLKETKWKSEYQQSLENEVLDTKKDEKKISERAFKEVPALKKFAHLAKYYGNNGVLDLQMAQLPKRFSKHMRKMKQELEIQLQPIVTLEERGMIVEISNCNGATEVQKLLAAWYKKDNLTPNCRFIRFALAASLEIWTTKALTKKGHGEDWFRAHVYADVWGKAFLSDDEFETKRSECHSQVMKALKDIDGDSRLQKLDFIWRDLSSGNDLITTEEKPSLKGVKADVKKAELLKINTLNLWSKQVKSHLLMQELESISCQWQGTKLTIYGSRLLSSDLVLAYQKGSFQMPVSARHMPEFAKLLMAVISLKRTVKLNYAKFTLILEAKQKQEVEDLLFDSDPLNEISFVSNSTNSDNEEDEQEKDDGEEEFVEKTLLQVKGLKPDEEDLKKFADWEDLLLFDRAKRRKTSQA